MVIVRNYSVFYGISSGVRCRGDILAERSVADFILHFAADHRARVDKFLRFAVISKGFRGRRCCDVYVRFCDDDFHRAALRFVMVAVDHDLVCYGVSTCVRCRGDILAERSVADFILHSACGGRACGDKFLRLARIGKPGLCGGCGNPHVCFRYGNGNRRFRFEIAVGVVALYAIINAVSTRVGNGRNGSAPLVIRAEAVLERAVRGFARRHERMRRAVVLKILYGYGQSRKFGHLLFDLERNDFFRSRVVVRSLYRGFDEILTCRRGHGSGIFAVLARRVSERGSAELSDRDGRRGFVAVVPVRDSQRGDFVVRFCDRELQRYRSGVALVGRFPLVRFSVGQRKRHVVIARVHAAVVGRDGVARVLGYDRRLFLARIYRRSDNRGLEYGLFFPLGFAARKARERRYRKTKNRNREFHEFSHFSAPFSHL